LYTSGENKKEKVTRILVYKKFKTAIKFCTKEVNNIRRKRESIERQTEQESSKII